MNCFSNLPYSPVLFFIRFSDYGQRPGIHWQILNNRNVKCTRIKLANKYFLPSSPPSTPPPCRCCPRPQLPSCLSLRRQTLLIWMQKLGQSWAFCGSMSSPAHLPPPFWWQWWLSCVESGAAAWEVSCGGSNISLSCIHLPMRFASRVVSHSAKLAAKLGLGVGGGGLGSMGGAGSILGGHPGGVWSGKGTAPLADSNRGTVIALNPPCALTTTAGSRASTARSRPFRCMTD
jgi:hypothetical protein